ncbi:MAG: hypothetical protein HWE20_03815 [Gammaproteobacteria bacterium]|nr:hypothetical protein [Gammaproteobacteria bacterium]
MTTDKPEIGALFDQEEKNLIDSFEAEGAALEINNRSDEALSHFAQVADNTTMLERGSEASVDEVLNFIESIEPKNGTTNSSSVDVIRSARDARTQRIINNARD